MPKVTSSDINEFLTQLAKTRRLQAWAAVGGGCVLALFGPLVVTVIYELQRMFDTTPHQYGFWETFSIICFITLPIFFAIAKLMEGSLLERYTEATADAGFGFRMVRGRGAVLVLIIDIANIGPRLVLWGAEQIQLGLRVDNVQRERVVQAILTLLADDYGIKPVKLLLPDEHPDALEPLLAFLLAHQLVDLSKKADRVWLTSATREKLIKPRTPQTNRRY